MDARRRRSAPFRLRNYRAAFQWDAQAIMRHVERFSLDRFVARLRTEVEHPLRG